MSIIISNLTKRFGAFTALDDVSATLPAGELTALLGPSGSGKTTLLRIAAGLEQADSGSLRVFDEDVAGQSLRERRVGFVFQHYALFRHQTVAENIAFPMRVRPRRARPDRVAIRSKVDELLDLVQLDGLASRYPHQLSGGQRQRVALARALAVEPRLLLLDEPFGALDAQVRTSLRRWLRDLHHRTGITTLFVTHDQEEALEVADTVVVMSQGRIEQVGSPQEVYDHPATPFVHRFLGQINIFHGRWEPDGEVAQVAGHRLQAPGGTADHEALVVVRPHDLLVRRTASEAAAIRSTILSVHAAGPLTHLELKTTASDRRVTAHLTRDQFRELQAGVGDTVYIGFSSYQTYQRQHAESELVGLDYQI